MIAPGDNLNMENRDPHEINLYLQVGYDDIIAESEDVRSIDCVWKNSFKCFTCSKNCCYKFLTVLCSLPCSFLWGCCFACLTFEHIWSVMPAYRMIRIQCRALRLFIQLFAQSCISPTCEAIGSLCYRINVNMGKGGPVDGGPPPPPGRNNDMV